MNLRRYGLLTEQSINTETYFESVFFRFDVDIAGSQVDCLHKQFIDKFNNRGGL